MIQRDAHARPVKVVGFGAGGHAKVILEILLSQGNSDHQDNTEINLPGNSGRLNR